MHAIFLLTHPGTPILLLPSLQYATPGRPPAPLFLGALTLDSAATGSSTITVTPPPGTFTAPTLTVPGLPPEIATHIRGLPGIWCVAIDPAGNVLAEWPACQPGYPSDAVLALFPRGTFSPPPSSPFQAAIADGIYTAAVSHTWPPGSPPPESLPSIPLGASIANHLLARLPAPPLPAGSFFGEAAVAYAPRSQDEVTILRTRRQAAIDTLRQVTINGQQVGAGLLGVMAKNVSIEWAAPPAQPVMQQHAAPPPCGWDANTRTVFLAPGLPAELDAAFLAAALYAAHGSLSGAGALSRLLIPAMFASPPPTLSSAALSAALATEAARAWLLLAEIACAPTLTRSAAAILGEFPWGSPALALLPPSTAIGTSYDAAIAGAVSRATEMLLPRLSSAVDAIHAETMSIRSQWFSPRTRGTLPRPQLPPPAPTALPTRVQTESPPPQAATRAHTGPTHICGEDPRWEVIITAHAPPKVIYTAPTISPMRGALMIHIAPGESYKEAMLWFDRDDGCRVYLAHTPATDVDRLMVAQAAVVICTDPTEATSQPQTVPVRRI